LRVAHTAAALLPARIATLLEAHVHAAQLALRKCAIPSLLFVCRCVPPALAQPAAAAFDAANVGCLLVLLRTPASAAPPGSAARQQLQLPVRAGGLGVLSLEAIGPAAHVASVRDSLSLLQEVRPAIVAGFTSPLTATQSELAALPTPPGAAASSLASYRQALAALPVASYLLLRDPVEPASQPPRGSAVGGRTSASTADEEEEGGSLQAKLTRPIVAAARDAFLARLQVEYGGLPGHLALAQAHYLSFSRGGSLCLESWTPLPGVLSWHLRLFLRAALRLVPAVAAGPAPWRCSHCQKPQPPGLPALGHAMSCGNAVRRHNCFAAAGLDVLRAFPGRPSLRREVAGVPGQHDRMDAVVDGAHVGRASAAEEAEAVAAYTGAPSPAPAAAAAAARVALGGGADTRRLLVDFMVTEPMGLTCLEREHTDTVAAAAAAAGARSKRASYASKVDPSRCRLVPFVAETWGCLDAGLVSFLKSTALLAAPRLAGRGSASSDEEEERRNVRVANSIMRGWRIRLSAGIAQATAEHLDSRFFPLAGTVERQSYVRYAPRGLCGGGGPDQGFLGPSGRVRGAAPALVF
jgi:hypothetical protein